MILFVPRYHHKDRNSGSAEQDEQEEVQEISQEGWFETSSTIDVSVLNHNSCYKLLKLCYLIGCQQVCHS